MGKPIAPGLTFGVYTVERKLGSGGMAEVWECFHHGLGRRVAIKVLRSTYSDSEAGRARFFAEAKALASIDSEYVVRILDCGEAEGQFHYIVMERLAGLTLRELLDRRGPLPESAALWIAIDACHGVAAAHRAGLIHRDIKPGNLFVTSLDDRDPRCKVLDFGIAKGIGETPTRDGSLVGTVSYMAPEQARSEPSGTATDVYALGVVLFEAITGVPFVDGVSEEAQLFRILNGQRSERGWDNMSHRVTRIVRKATEFHPNSRYQSVAELALELEQAAVAASGGARTGDTVSFALPKGGHQRRLVGLASLLVVGCFGVSLGFLLAQGINGRESVTHVALQGEVATSTNALVASDLVADDTAHSFDAAPSAECRPSPPRGERERSTAPNVRRSDLHKVNQVGRTALTQDVPRSKETKPIEISNQRRPVGVFVVRNPYQKTLDEVP